MEREDYLKKTGVKLWHQYENLFHWYFHSSDILDSATIKLTNKSFVLLKI